MPLVREIYGRRIRSTRRSGAFIRVVFVSKQRGGPREEMLMLFEKYLRDRHILFTPTPKP